MSQRPASARPESDSEIKIGEHVRQTMFGLASTGKLTPKVVADLSDRSHCKATFGLNHPFLQNVMPDTPLHAQGSDENGYSRFWRDPLDIDGARFLTCSQWFAWQRPAFDRWVRDSRSLRNGGLAIGARTTPIQATSAAGPIRRLPGRLTR